MDHGAGRGKDQKDQKDQKEEKIRRSRRSIGSFSVGIIFSDLVAAAVDRVDPVRAY